VIPVGALEWLRSAELVPLWRAVRARLLRNGRRATGKLVVRCADPRERAAVGQLLKHAVGAEVRIDLAALDRMLRDSAAGAGLVDVVEAVTGPVPDRRADAAAEEARRESLREYGRIAVTAAGLDGYEWVTPWLERIWRSGVLGRFTSGEARKLVSQAATTLGLVLDGQSRLWARGELAERVTGTAHGLDGDAILTRLVLRGISLATTGSAEPPADPVERRALWESVGVVSDTVATTVLTYGLRPLGTDWRSTLLRDRADHHVESHLTLRELRQLSPLRLAPQTVYVCENPRVLEATAEACASVAMVCTLGNPTTVTLSLLAELASIDGVRLVYHGDFDWPGIAIADRVMRRTGAAPWRFGAADYLAAVRAMRSRGTPAQPLAGLPVETAWDRDLRRSMLREGAAVHEESVLEVLLLDLSAGSRG
jgi:uncharacterized protein (TIGR02679 family)